MDSVEKSGVFSYEIIYREKTCNSRINNGFSFSYFLIWKLILYRHGSCARPFYEIRYSLIMVQNKI